MNSMPSAVWISAEAASAVFPLAGSRRKPRSGRIWVVRRVAFMTVTNTAGDTTQELDDQDFDLAIADSGLQRWQGGRRRPKPGGGQLARHPEDPWMAGTPTAPPPPLPKPEATPAGANPRPPP